MEPKITFDDSAVPFILDVFGKAEKDGFVVEKKNPSQKVITPRGEEIKVSEFAGVRKGSAIFVKNDIVSLLEAAEAIK
jgi:hypothetical protein